MKRKYVLQFLLSVILLSQFASLLTANADETIVLTAVEDTWVNNTGEISKTEPTLDVMYMYGVKTIAYVMFDISSIPTNAKIKSAKFQIKVKTFTIDTYNVVSAYVTSSNWSESEITWDNKPELKAENLIESKVIKLLNETYVFSSVLGKIESEIEDKLKRGDTKLSIGLASSLDVPTCVMFYSLELGEAPKLVVTYSTTTLTPTPNPSPTPSPSPAPEVTREAIPTWLSMVLGALIITLLIIMIVLFVYRRKVRTTHKSF